MRKFTLLIALLSLTQISYAQPSTSLEKNLASFDIGLLGSWIHYERILSEKSTINASLGMEGILYGSSDKFNYAFTPTVTLGPRYYYNFKGRVAREKKTINNSADFIGIEGKYVPGIFTVSNNADKYEKDLFLLLNWGLRRSIGKKIIFDLSGGYMMQVGHSPDQGEFALNFKFGYVFL